jgi:transcriptional regulator with XRE-family HTH domain
VARRTPRADRTDPSQALVARVRDRLKQARLRLGLSLTRLATLSGVSKSMLGAIESGDSTPTILTLWQIAGAWQLPFDSLLAEARQVGTRVLTAAAAKTLSTRDGSFSRRSLFPPDPRRATELYEVTLAAHGEEHAEPHAPGTRENLFVARGLLILQVGDEQHRLEAGDAIVFDADVPHVYGNPTNLPLVMYIVMTTE